MGRGHPPLPQPAPHRALALCAPGARAASSGVAGAGHPAAAHPRGGRGMVTRHGRRAGAVLSHLALRALRDDCLILRAAQAPRAQREYQAVIGVDPVNFSLLASEEQVRILEGYRAFLAGRTPADGTLCIHARTSRYDLTPYLEQLEHTARTHREPGYRQMAVSHRQFVEQLAASRVLLTRGFWVRVSVVLPLRARHARQLTDDDH